MPKDKMGIGDSVEASISVPEGEAAGMMDLDPIIERGDRTPPSTADLRVEKTDRGWAVFEDASAAPVTIRSVSFFTTEAEAQDALTFYAEVR